MPLRRHCSSEAEDAFFAEEYGWRHAAWASPLTDRYRRARACRIMQLKEQPAWRRRSGRGGCQQRKEPPHAAAPLAAYVSRGLLDGGAREDARAFSRGADLAMSDRAGVETGLRLYGR